jgi:hypothetical protein
MEDPTPLSAELCTPTGVPNWFRAPEEGRLALDQPDILGSKTSNISELAYQKTETSQYLNSVNTYIIITSSYEIQY